MRQDNADYTVSLRRFDELMSYMGDIPYVYDDGVGEEFDIDYDLEFLKVDGREG
jgi:hypothetical protein